MSLLICKSWKEFQISSFYIHFLCCDQPGNHLIWSSTGSEDVFILTWSRVGCWGVKCSLSLSVTLTATITTTNTVHYNISLIVIQWINQMFLEQSILVCTYRNVAKFQSVTMSPYQESSGFWFLEDHKPNKRLTLKSRKVNKVSVEILENDLYRNFMPFRLLVWLEWSLHLGKGSIQIKK